MALSVFGAYDIRGIIDEDLTDDIVAYVAEGVVQLTSSKRIAIGHDVRESSPRFAKILTDVCVRLGVDVYQLGLCGTEETYFSSMHGTSDGHALDACIMVTASHNPIEYNGMKFVRHGGKPFSPQEDMEALKTYVANRLAGEVGLLNAETVGQIFDMQDKTAYIQHLLSFVDTAKLKPLKIVMTAGNGCAGPVAALLEKELPMLEFIKVQHEPDGTFPNGIPNPMLPETRQATIDAIRAHKADFGIAWDGDFDRCFFFDEDGTFLSNYYMLGFLMEQILKTHPNAAIVHDARLLWNLEEIAKRTGARCVMSEVGHGYFKKKMRDENAVFGGEVSGHFYFKDFAYCDSGMIPWLLIAQMVSESGTSLKNLVAERLQQFPAAEECNRKLTRDAQEIFAALEAHYTVSCVDKHHFDGLSMAFDGWRFNVRPSSNERKILRLNMEATSQAFLQEKQQEILFLLDRL